jgi:hypothetical protein
MFVDPARRAAVTMTTTADLRSISSGFVVKSRGRKTHNANGHLTAILVGKKGNGEDQQGGTSKENTLGSVRDMLITRGLGDSAYVHRGDESGGIRSCCQVEVFDEAGLGWPHVRTGLVSKRLGANYPV